MFVYVYVGQVIFVRESKPLTCSLQYKKDMQRDRKKTKGAENGERNKKKIFSIEKETLFFLRI